MSQDAKQSIRVGVVGLGRGRSFARGSKFAGMELVALCDVLEEPLRKLATELDVAAYTNYHDFLNHDMDAVILANFFHEHGSFAIEALKADKHVMSETMACRTIGEGVRLARAVEESGKIYMFAENYPYMAMNQEMRRLYQEGEIGEVLYAEGEYNHPMDERVRLSISPGFNHWRNHEPSTYYCTHGLAPLMYITDTMPESVIALSIADREQEKKTLRVSDPGSVILCRMDNGSVFRIMGIELPGERIYYRLHGTRGLMESTPDRKVHIEHDEWDRRPGDFSDVTYKPDFPEHRELARRAGHGGGDFWVNWHFAEAIRNNRQPYLDVYRGLAMSVVGIVGWKSALKEGERFDVPDFRDEAVRKQYENDNFSPWPEDRGPGQPLPSIRGEITPSKEMFALAREVWAKELNYHGE